MNRWWAATWPQAAALLVVVLLWGVTVWQRSAWFGQLAWEGHHWLTGVSVKFLSNWFHEGAFQLGFAMLGNPASIEFETVASRAPYVSYPPGAMLIPHLVDWTTGSPPTVARVMAVNLANQLLAALLLSGATAALVRRRGGTPIIAALLSISPAAVWLLNPAAMYWMQNIYFSDQAVVLPVAALIYLEASGHGAPSRWRRALETVVVFFGLACDWYFAFLILGLWLKRSVQAGRSPRQWMIEALWLGVPSVLLVGLYLIQLNSLDAFSLLSERFLTRTGLSERGTAETARFVSAFWRGHVPRAVGTDGLVAFGVATVTLVWLAARRPRRLEAAACAIWLVGATLVQTYVFRNHSAVHDFSALKYVLLVAFVSFGLLPAALVAHFTGSAGGRGRGRAFLVVMVTFGGAGLYAGRHHLNYPDFFLTPEPAFEATGGFLRENTGYADVVFSPDREIPVEPPHFLAHSRKRVYLVESPARLRESMRGLPDMARPLLFFEKPPDARWQEVLASSPVASRGHFRLYEVKTERALAQ